MPAVSPLSRFYAATFGPFLLLPITILIGSYNDATGQLLLWVALSVFAVSTIYVQLFARCPKCRWRIASFGRPFVRSLPPRLCPRCGTDLSRSI
jgi:tRNA(Ile2) C34 agmatinyltransferase TiaS